MNSVAQWLDTWAAMIRARDIDAARSLFAEDVLAFGSLSQAMLGRDALERDQWEPIWNRTRGFRFEEWWVVLDDSHGVVVASTWSSEGEDEDRGWYPRRGRATLVLQRRDDTFVCVHSHFSMNPDTRPI